MYTTEIAIEDMNPSLNIKKVRAHPPIVRLNAPLNDIRHSRTIIIIYIRYLGQVCWDLTVADPAYFRFIKTGQFMGPCP